jgi:hypothetical protein
MSLAPIASVDLMPDVDKFDGTIRAVGRSRGL